MRHYLLLAVFTLASLSMQAQKLCFAGETAEPKTSQVLKKASAKTVCKEVIKVQPEGEKTCYYHVSDAYYPIGDYVYKRHYDGGAAYVVDGTDGNVYIQNPISAFSPGSWIKAEKNGNGALTVKLPQDIYDGIIEDDSGNEGGGGAVFAAVVGNSQQAALDLLPAGEDGLFRFFADISRGKQGDIIETDLQYETPLVAFGGAAMGCAGKRRQHADRKAAVRFCEQDVPGRQPVLVINELADHAKFLQLFY